MLASLFNLTGQEDFVYDGIYLRRSKGTTSDPMVRQTAFVPCPHLVKVEDEIQLAYVAKKGVWR
jgi:hypothetical protein